jgi:hypothetical protein
MTKKYRPYKTDELPRNVIRGSNLSFVIMHGTMFAGGVDPDLTAPLRPGERVLLRWRIPSWQRALVWTPEQKVRLIESLWLGLPIAGYVYNRAAYGSPLDDILVDGQQRWTAIKEYVEDAFPVYGRLFSELETQDRNGFGMIGFNALEVNTDDEAELIDIYERLAYGGTPHTKED